MKVRFTVKETKPLTKDVEFFGHPCDAIIESHLTDLILKHVDAEWEVIDNDVQYLFGGEKT